MTRWIALALGLATLLVLVGIRWCCVASTYGVATKHRLASVGEGVSHAWFVRPKAGHGFHLVLSSAVAVPPYKGLVSVSDGPTHQFHCRFEVSSQVNVACNWVSRRPEGDFVLDLYRASRYSTGSLGVNLDKYLGEAGKHYLIELNLAFEGQPPSDLELFVTYMGGNVDATRLGGLPAGHPVKDGVILLPAR